MNSELILPKHPQYYELDWLKWRLTYEGGRQFKEKYLKKLSKREDSTDFSDRKEVTYCPAFAKAGINDIRNSIYQRLAAINRIGGSESYKTAVDGMSGGVDLLGSSMNSFMGCDVLPELMVMKRVGIYVDMPKKRGPTLADNLGIRPYLYIYTTENIINWTFDCEMRYESVLLQETRYTYDEKTGFPNGVQTYHRRLYKKDGKVAVTFYKGNQEEETYELDLEEIPFIPLELSESMMNDIADYQIALMNLASSDMSYVLKSNYPFYVEQYSPYTDAASQYLKQPENPDATGTQATTSVDSNREVSVGVATGRRYPVGTDAPQFIHPSSDPLKASMDKQEQLKREIRLLLNLSIANLKPMRSSSESKQEDEGSLESGLSYIGLELEHAERRIAEIWAMYEGKEKPATIHYPEQYSIRTNEEIRKEAVDLKDMVEIIPSPTYQKEIQKKISTTLLSDSTPRKLLEKIHEEIDQAINTTSDPETIKNDVEMCLVDLEGASKLRGYPSGSVEKAKKDHADRAARIAQAQAAVTDAGARGVNDLSTNPGKEAQGEKNRSMDTTLDSSVKNKQRGEGK